MEAEIVVWGDEEGLEQVALSQRVQLSSDVNIPAYDGDGAAEPKEPRIVRTGIAINETAISDDKQNTKNDLKRCPTGALVARVVNIFKAPVLTFLPVKVECGNLSVVSLEVSEIKVVL